MVQKGKLNGCSVTLAGRRSQSKLDLVKNKLYIHCISDARGNSFLSDGQDNFLAYFSHFLHYFSGVWGFSLWGILSWAWWVARRVMRHEADVYHAVVITALSRWRHNAILLTSVCGYLKNNGRGILPDIRCQRILPYKQIFRLKCFSFVSFATFVPTYVPKNPLK